MLTKTAHTCSPVPSIDDCLIFKVLSTGRVLLEIMTNVIGGEYRESVDASTNWYWDTRMLLLTADPGDPYIQHTAP